MWQFLAVAAGVVLAAAALALCYVVWGAIL